MGQFHTFSIAILVYQRVMISHDISPGRQKRPRTPFKDLGRWGQTSTMATFCHPNSYFLEAVWVQRMENRYCMMENETRDRQHSWRGRSSSCQERWKTQMPVLGWLIDRKCLCFLHLPSSLPLIGSLPVPDMTAGRQWRSLTDKLYVNVICNICICI